MVRQLIWLLGLLLISGWANAVQIDVGVDRNPVNRDESFTLIFRASDSPDDDPDFAPLERDFDILSQQKKQQMSWVNGDSNHVSQWVLKVMAKRAGKLQIPSIAFGDDQTKPLAITVVDASASQPLNRNRSMFLQVELPAGKPYVQSQLIYTVRFYRRVQLAQAGLSELKIDNAVVEKLGEERSYNKQLNGVDYVVSELRYAIFPQKSGRLKIPPLELTAQVLMGQRSSRFNSYFNKPTTQTRRIHSNAIELTILPVPEKSKGHHWLPAEQVTLQQQWSNDDLQVMVGEPITRTITIKAKGVMVSQLPELLLNQSNSHLKVYPDKPLLHDEKSAEGITAIFQQKIAYIPSKEGAFKLPALELFWFNRQTETVEKAGFPAVTLTALPGATLPSAPKQIPKIVEIEAPQQAVQQPSVQPKAGNDNWLWLSLFLGIGWLATLLSVYRTRHKKSALKESPAKRLLPLKGTLKVLQEACQKNDPIEARKALLQWGELKYGATSLDAIGSETNIALQAEIKQLNGSLYGATEQAWKGEKLMQLVEELSVKGKGKALDGDGLEPLYRGEKI